MLTLKEAAAQLRIDPETLRLRIVSGDLKAMKTGPGLTSPWRISEEALADYIERNSVQVTP